MPSLDAFVHVAVVVVAAASRRHVVVCCCFTFVVLWLLMPPTYIFVDFVESTSCSLLWLGVGSVIGNKQCSHHP